MGGEAWCDSWEGVGSAFHFTFVSPPAPSPRTTSPVRDSQGTWAGKRALIVDSPSTISSSVSNLLAFFGFGVEQKGLQATEPPLVASADLLLFTAAMSLDQSQVVARVAAQHPGARCIVLTTRRRPTNASIPGLTRPAVRNLSSVSSRT
jgi:hypothetical protein